VIETIQQRQVTIFMAVASMYGTLARLRGADAGALHSLRLAISGGEPLPDAIAGAFKERFGIGIMEGYGLTETSPVVSINLPWNGRAKSVGRPLPGITVQAVDEQANPLPAGAQGELTVRGPCVMKGYHDKPRETGQVIRDGVFFTGDIGRVDSDGFVFITGRIKEMLIIAGENVFPREIEAVLEQHPAVAEVAVIGARDERHGELPVAFVILQPEATATPLELRDFCRAHLAAYKVPREIRVAENLPRAASGKILKRALQA
jgi:long-chain acyl-CoA synthetase